MLSTNWNVLHVWIPLIKDEHFFRWGFVFTRIIHFISSGQLYLGKKMIFVQCCFCSAQWRFVLAAGRWISGNSCTPSDAVQEQHKLLWLPGFRQPLWVGIHTLSKHFSVVCTDNVPSEVSTQKQSRDLGGNIAEQRHSQEEAGICNVLNCCSALRSPSQSPQIFKFRLALDLCWLFSDNIFFLLFSSVKNGNKSKIP